MLLHTTLPVSAGLLHDAERYMGALGAYHDGAVGPIIECLADALELAAVMGSRVASDVDEVLAEWALANTDRGVSYQAFDLISMLEEASSLDGIRRIAAR